jgi:3',5'-nucleoside bisphosphate phosphatase
LGKTDLHTHTYYSDGAYSPDELINLATEKKLKAISITDHDTISGYLKAKAPAMEAGIELIPGVEISSVWEDREVHILAYLFDEGDPAFQNLLKSQKKARVERMKAIVEHLKRQGLDVDIEEIKAEAGLGNVGRPHAASVLIGKGYVASVAEAFIRYLSSEHISHIKTGYADVEHVVSVVKGAGGVLSLAHPGPMYTQDEIGQLVGLGLDGIECIHPSHNFNLQRTFTKMASSQNLLVTGGSDFHGKGKKDYDPYFGIVTLGDMHVQSLKRMARRRRELQESNEPNI